MLTGLLPSSTHRIGTHSPRSGKWMPCNCWLAMVKGVDDPGVARLPIQDVPRSATTRRHSNRRCPSGMLSQWDRRTNCTWCRTELSSKVLHTGLQTTSLLGLAATQSTLRRPTASGSSMRCTQAMPPQQAAVQTFSLFFR